MLRNFRRVLQRKQLSPLNLSHRNFLSHDYKCAEDWKNVNASDMINKINLNDFYNQLELSYSSKGVISAIDIDIFAHAVNDLANLDELKELLHKLRLSAETGNMLESTHHATIRNFIRFGHIEELIEILKQPLNFGVFLDEFTANIVLDELLTSEKYDLAANVAAITMLQEEFNNELTCALCQYAAYKYIKNYVPPPPAPPEDPKKKVEEIKIRIKFLRNPYFDEHFDLKDTLLLSGKTLAWISEQRSNNLNNNLEIIGWLIFKKYDKLKTLCKKFVNTKTLKIYKEVLELIEKEKNTVEDSKETLEECYAILSKQEPASGTIDESIKTSIENAINKVQNKDIAMQQKLFRSWVSVRELKLEEQTKRLDRAKRMQLIQQKQKHLQEEEKKLWFFEKEDQIDLQIEEKEKLVESSPISKKASNKTDENYVPPEILPKSNKL